MVDKTSVMQIIGSLMKHPQYLSESDRYQLTLDDFYYKFHRYIFAAIENSAKGTESEPDFKGLFGDIDVNSNKLAPENIERIYQAHVARKDEQHFARLVPNAEVAENDYNLAVSSYVEQPDTREKIDIDELNERIVGIVERQAKLRAEIERLISQIA